MKIEAIPLLKDNYAWLLYGDDGAAVIIDPSESAPVEKMLEEKGLRLTCIVNTHHHGDHTGGNAALKKRYRCTIAAPAADAYRIAGMDIPLREGTVFSIGGANVEILETPGHTDGHICLYVPSEKALFCGDTLFAMGCGRLFEGTPEQMWHSLSKIRALPPDTRLYCGHEYTLSNGEFCLSIEPENKALQERMEQVRKTRAENKPTIPTTLALEERTNAFLRAGSAERFAEIRRLKDAW